MVARIFAFATLFATAFAACTTEQLTAHGLAGSTGKQTVTLSRLEEHNNGTTSVFENGAYLCDVASDLIWTKSDRSISDRAAMLGKRCVGRREVPETLWGRTDYCPCVADTCNNAAGCKGKGCPQGCACVYENYGGGSSCGCI